MVALLVCECMYLLMQATPIGLRYKIKISLVLWGLEQHLDYGQLLNIAKAFFFLPKENKNFTIVVYTGVCM